jgi:hypothetical protein
MVAIGWIKNQPRPVIWPDGKWRGFDIFKVLIEVYFGIASKRNFANRSTPKF